MTTPLKTTAEPCYLLCQTGLQYQLLGVPPPRGAPLPVDSLDAQQHPPLPLELGQAAVEVGCRPAEQAHKQHDAHQCQPPPVEGASLAQRKGDLRPAEQAATQAVGDVGHLCHGTEAHGHRGELGLAASDTCPFAGKLSDGAAIWLHRLQSIL